LLANIAFSISCWLVISTLFPDSAEKGKTGRGWSKRRERGLGMEKEARDKGAQEESRRAQG